jgi:TolA-binding protein
VIAWQFERRAERAATVPELPPVPDRFAVAARAVPVPAELLDPSARPAWMRATPPSIRLSATPPPDLSGAQWARFVQAFDVAIHSWQSGSYAEAATQLESVAVAYPLVPEAHFYHGTAWLLAGAPAQAVEPLRRAEAHAPPWLQPDAAWYLGLALLDALRPGEAVAVFAETCAEGHALACDAADYLRTTPQPSG